MLENGEQQNVGGEELHKPPPQANDERLWKSVFDFQFEMTIS